ncbi:calcium-binding protein [Streptomyces sp. NPDC086023]|uniref:calcium-binding protein n=1 Tax=Streptomyces sp. NPDC086023 TaxID=3365746 RepID=UPI0037D780D0
MIRGGTGGDRLVGDNWAGTSLGAGNDRITGLGGNDTLFGDNVDPTGAAPAGTAGGHDRLSGGTGSDALHAGPGNDLLDGGPEYDACDGGAGDKAVACETVTGVP